MNKLLSEAPALPVPKVTIPVTFLGRKQRLMAINANTGDPINPKPKQQNKRSNTTMNNKLIGVISLIVKVSLLIGGVALWKMPSIHVIFDIPFYQVVGSIQLIVLAYLELEPHFAKSKKSKRPAAQHTNPRPSDFIETER